MLRPLLLAVLTLLIVQGGVRAGDGGTAPAPVPAKAPAKRASHMEYTKVASKALGRDIPVGVYLPAAYSAEPERRFPVLYFLHGLFGNERKWEQRGTNGILDDLIAKGLTPMIVVCPDGENSMYVNWVSGDGNWKDFVVQDLVAFADANYRTVPERAARGLSGDSMGGYGALNIGFQHHDVFGSVSAHSAALFPVDPDGVSAGVKRWAKRWGDVFGDPVDKDFWKANNPIQLAESLPAEEFADLAIYFDVGEHDHFGFDVTNRALDAVLVKRRIAHKFAVHSGDHGREYFTDNVANSLRFHGERFAKSAAQPARRDA